MNSTPLKIFLVDDDALYLKNLEIEFLELFNYSIETYSTGESCLENLEHLPDVIVLDYHLNGILKHAMNGLQTLDRIKLKHPEIPVVMLSGQDKIEVAVSCLHHHAFDYVVKSETAFLRIKKLIGTILKNRKMEKELNWYMNRM